MALNQTELERLYVALGLDTDDYDKGLKEAEKKTEGFGKRIGKTTAAAAGGLAVAGAGIGLAIGQAAFDIDQQIDAATKSLQTQLNISEQEALELGQTVQDVYSNNFGESIEDVGQRIAIVRQQFGELRGEELQAITENATAAADAFDEDFGDVIDAQKVLMEEFGLSATESMDFVASGFQRGLNRSGDFLDSIREYGNLFGDADASAEQFFSTLETGGEGGVLGTDKIADAFKEFQIIALEASDDANAAFEQIFGDDLNMFLDEIQAGDETMANLFDKTIKRLDEISDPVEKQRLGVELFGTQWEDLGSSITETVDLTKTSLEDLSGATASLNDQYDTLGAQFEAVQRRATVALAPLGDLIGDNLLALLEEATPVFEQFAQTLSETVGPAAMLINDAWTRIGAAMGITNEEVTTMDVLMAALKGTLDAVIIGIQALAVVMQGLAWYIETVSENWGKMAAVFDAAKGSVSDAGEAIAESIPDWLIPGSPTPFEEGLRGISKALDDLPDMASAFAPGAGQLAPAGSGMAGGNTIINIDGVSATTTGEPGEAAIQSTVNLLREAIARKKASS